MTAATSLRDDIRSVLTSVAAPHEESPAVVRKRRIIVAVVLVLGAVTLALSLNQTPGDPTFYWLTFLLAAIWAGGAFASGPLHLGGVNWRGQVRRPVLTGLGLGAAVGAAFVVGALIAREIDPIAEFITRVLVFANQGALWLVVVITLVNGVAEELFFRGSLYTALGGRAPVVISTVMYIIATSASGNPMLGFAAIILGTVCALERRATGGVLAPMLTHLVWGLIMVLALPPLFGV
ncbi:CAAX protease family protein [Mycobacterium sp. MS1601]|uniref:CPBP family intramembrane glutamic endopeptidase n=1 Tax=Mycobacterium sp. MS1601 TaxID=1936029 RepID=UPI0009792279|nr:type II CAAX endopeptidase family protein [Mycobacterium sp. MS1601]AQA04029.1 CAAX protease family protein [Mycobacterium sp. MS1601]